ncbi:Uncharacterized protein OS=Singulisphaera acidiphila (strain ATCC BAA-1392 / DSM 18658 / VKM B-2454 / MOB10) GN=Sinac_4288 PE=4 SV=1: DUF4325 [Gemmataceae bacterium]|nr:Uncharacterized protein OS=Singulisphaera acidiphila (strain ATCC BAA-1392 / DSM 18658 / VKM B-2454 / MOB10) GN=Sinac_4288 PE=4 SV=1: DUF4325 [Gemmataceae bacterium]VTT97574.1 Uncharacterized protein OS=Singulisphaera acidiphila (strain ATCC BAA-1392 / DSM 18658 / VKM B-2454 / MOB10) GN=Sinac_4288 PE=4 SV=1: DUF4325 [Gemmataceae bacterium]
MTQTVIHVAEWFGPICIDPDDGAKLCDAVHQALDRGECAVLDFEGVTTLASLFLNTAVGCLYSFFDKDDLAERLRWKGLDATDESVLRFVQKNAIRFYAAKQPQQAALTKAAARVGAE